MDLTKDKYYKSGYQAYKEGVPIQNNPFQYRAAGVFLEAKWATGWKDAEKEGLKKHVR